jgi:hypothetical protein
MAKATQALSLTKEPRKTEQTRKLTEIGRVMQKIEEACEVMALVDEARQRATKNDPRLDTALKTAEKEAMDREKCLLLAISTLEPETLDDIAALAVVAKDTFDTWASWQGADSSEDCHNCQKGIDYDCEIKDQEERIRRMLDAMVRGLEANGARLPPYFAERYNGLNGPSTGWAERVAELRARVTQAEKAD